MQSQVHKRDVRIPIRLLRCCDEEMVDAPYLGFLAFLHVLRRVELIRAKTYRIFLFTFCPREYHDLAAHLRSELDSEMSEAANTDDTYPIGG